MPHLEIYFQVDNQDKEAFLYLVIKVLRYVLIKEDFELQIYYYDSFEELEARFTDARFHLFTTHAVRSYSEAEYLPGDFLVFGKETAGLGLEIITRRWNDCVRIPMRQNLRSLNLSNSVAVAVYEGLRQNAFGGLV